MEYKLREVFEIIGQAFRIGKRIFMRDANDRVA